ncbi:MAG TPA: radical SAM protein [Blastocatellia bacterium]|nr:radical SAM protein [Blastocatellia bacterium]
MDTRQFAAAWRKIVSGKAPLLSIEITRECPLRCPGCYAYEDNHLGGLVTLRQLTDSRDDDLVHGVVELVKQQKPQQVSIVGGEPLIRHRELSRILPRLSGMGVNTLVVTSAVIPIPAEWMSIPRVKVAVSVDGLRDDHDKRRYPATYDRILKNIAGVKIDISWVITAPQMERSGYLDEYLSFWTSVPEVDRIWLSIYTPQKGESSNEILSREQRRQLAQILPGLKHRYPALFVPTGMEDSILTPPVNPDECVFSKLSVNYSADLKTRVEPCFFGGNPDCSQCGCAVSTSLHSIGKKKVLGPIKINHLMKGSLAIGSLVNRLCSNAPQGVRWAGKPGF